MKNFGIICTIGFMAIMISCGSSRESTAARETAPDREQDRGRSNVEAATASSKPISSPRTVTSTAAASARTSKKEAMDESNNIKRMYGDLNMTKGQVQKFEEKWNSSMEMWKRGNPNKTMNNFERIEYQDRILRDILDDNQFEAYQEWVRKEVDRG